MDHEGHAEGLETNGPAAGQSVEPAEYRISIKEQDEARNEQDAAQPAVNEPFTDKEPVAAAFSSTAKSGKAFLL